MTTKQTRVVALVAALALPIGIVTFSIASAHGAAHVTAERTTVSGRPAAVREQPDNDVETNDDGAQAAQVKRTAHVAAKAAAGDGDGETNDDAPRGTSPRSH